MGPKSMLMPGWMKAAMGAPGRLAGTGLVWAAMLLAPGDVPAATTIGQTFTPDATCAPAFTWVQSVSQADNYATPTAGVITTWSYMGLNPGPEQLKFKLFRRVGLHDFLVVGESSLETSTENVLATFPTRIPAGPGDVIGLYSHTALLCGRGAGGYVSHFHAGEGAPGSTSTYVEDGFPLQLNVSATLEPDLDQDGFGDETQDACPGDRGDQTAPCGVAPPPLVPVDNPAVCAGREATIEGSEAAEVLTGTPKDDVIAAAGGDDVVRAGTGNDLICGGTGNDELKGAAGKDVILGDEGRDKLDGGAGRGDRCEGGPSRDKATARCEKQKGL